MTVRIHPTADVSPDALIGDGTSIWHHAQVREGSVIGENCIIGKGVYIDQGVHIGENVKHTFVVTDTGSPNTLTIRFFTIPKVKFRPQRQRIEGITHESPVYEVFRM